LFICFTGGQKPFAFTDNTLSDFKKPDATQGMSLRYIEILAEQKRKYRDWSLCPSKYEPEAKEPLCLSRKTLIFRAGSNDMSGKFGHGAHTPWEEFQNTMSKKNYQKTIDGTAFPKRANYANDS